MKIAALVQPAWLHLLTKFPRVVLIFLSVIVLKRPLARITSVIHPVKKVIKDWTIYGTAEISPLAAKLNLRVDTFLMTDR